MLKSTETRWILSLQEFEVISNWFDQHKLNFGKENLFPRQDYYLKLLNNNALGIKIREPKIAPDGTAESKLEIKILNQDFGAQKFNNGNQGVVNSWNKFSFETVRDEQETKKIIDSFTNKHKKDDWIKIDKDRLLLKYDLTTKSIVSGSTIIDEGTGIELTKFKIEDKIYYSLGIEAFSVSNKELENFNATMNFLFNQIKISGLNSQNSISYPEIINHHFLKI
jgi:hypothetical protein